MRFLLVITFLLDVAMKIWVRQLPASAGRFAFWSPAGPIGIVPSVNAVLAFSLPIPNAWIWPIGWIVVAVLVGALGRISNLKSQISNPHSAALLAIILGAISNLTDRTFLGGVTDYLSFTSLFPAFNVADLLILGGIIGWMRSTRSSVDVS